MNIRVGKTYIRDGCPDDSHVTIGTSNVKLQTEFQILTADGRRIYHITSKTKEHERTQKKTQVDLSTNNFMTTVFFFELLEVSFHRLH